LQEMACKDQPSMGLDYPVPRSPRLQACGRRDRERERERERETERERERERETERESRNLKSIVKEKTSQTGKQQTQTKAHQGM